MPKEIKVLFKQPKKDAELISVVDNFKVYQELVEGYIELVALPTIKNVLVLLNEEGKIYNKAPNIYVDEYDDVFVGNMVIVGTKDDGFRSLTDAEVKKIQKYLQANDVRNN